ncbi:Major Facilitator Superfamily protein [Quadrisphaera granulorum]|uniref:MFS transporter n=1 Tax=Quadrisphaera granulorum TaxID=317664 RepID=A0A315ZMP4_9ACTN|nr:MFS transporter [Quadrisphaera granulorum]PWJ46905.1 MFS transporter [Quadrisphaera granulorum]SZE98997.1 Major Facilitator Superfamily protein [Quadrisphaera granulorum]
MIVPSTVAAAALSVYARRSWRSSSPLLDLRLYRDRVYRAASVEVFFNGAALFGGLMVMPLYFQVLLGRDILETGLLLIAFSVGAAATFPLAGRLTDRYGGGCVATTGLLITAAATAPFAVLNADADLVAVESLQVLRGVGLALCGTPVVSTALATVQSHQLPDATAQVNVLSRVGGAIGSAVFISVLSTRLPAEASGSAATDAFHATFAWLTAATLAALLGSGWLIHEQRRAMATPATT